MKLGDYLREEGEAVSAFAERIGTSAETVRRYVNGTRWPERENAERIVAATGGKVTPNDFLGLEPEAEPA